MQALDRISQRVKPGAMDSISVGWSQRNITPEEPLKLMGYGWKGNYTSVHDSLMLRCLYFEDGQQSVALLSYDLMIVHPDLSAAIRHAVDTAGLDLNGLYFTAVHTHKGYGEWASGLGGLLTAGGYDESLVRFIAKQTLAAIRQAHAEKEVASLGYSAYAQPELVHNRLSKGLPEDSLLRVLKLKQASGKSAALCTFAAHATFINSKSMQLSADYPGALVKILEKHADIDFALFAAGAVGSHSPYRQGPFSYSSMQSYADRLAEPLLKNWDTIRTEPAGLLEFICVPLALGPSQLKVSEHWRVRDWVFRAFFGELSPELTALRLGPTVLLGTPADFSGMLYPHLNADPLHLMVTSFNGSYIGYVIPDEEYSRAHREARELNWFGPYTGSYLTETINRLLAIFRD